MMPRGHSYHETTNPFLPALIGLLVRSDAQPMAAVMSMSGNLNAVDGIFEGCLLGRAGIANLQHQGKR
jgi:hypothetical protein